MKINRKTVSKIIWILLALICTATFLTVFINFSAAFSSYPKLIKETKADDFYTPEIQASLISSYNESLTAISCMFVFVNVWYAAFAVLIVQKIWTLFKHQTVEINDVQPQITETDY